MNDIVSAATRTKHKTRIGELSFDLGMPTGETVTKLYDEMDFQRAVQAYLWAAPTVGMEESRQTIELNSGAGNGDIVICEGYRDLSEFLTPNLTTPYIMALLNLAEHGPMVVEYPAGATAGVVDDWWDRPVTDLGQPGPDRGQGCKYLFVGPGQEAPAAEGHHVIRSRTVKNLFFYRVLDPDPEKANALKRAVKIYPYSQRHNPPPTRFLTPRPDGELHIGVPPKGLGYWERVSDAISDGPVEERDRFFMAMLKPLGIEKGKPFRPDQRQKSILAEAAFVGEAMAKASTFDKRFEGIRYRPDAHWEYFIAPYYEIDQDTRNGTQLEERTALFYEGVGMSAGSISHTPGVGSAYLSVYHDKNGDAFDGGKTYRLRVPANPPVKMFWSITLYDAETRALIRNTQQIGDRSSRHDLKKNADGSVDLYFAPKVQPGFEKNWIPTVPGRAWFAYFRLYGPLEAYFDKSWPLPDIEQLPG